MKAIREGANDLNKNNAFVYLVKCEDYNVSSWDDAIVKFLILAETIESAIRAAHTEMKEYSHYRIIEVKFIGSVGIYVAGDKET